MNIAIKIDYDNREQYLDAKKLSKYLSKHIKNRGKSIINVFIENNTPFLSYIKHDPNIIYSTSNCK